ncbi:hypothetical protein CYMTET_34542, partial [Cymbomonas tetramitiformis]
MNFTGNTANGTGGAIYFMGPSPEMEEDARLRLAHSILQRNSADRHGGGAALSDDKSSGLVYAELNSNLIKDNRADAYGGGIMASLRARVDIFESVLQHNAAQSGGGLYLDIMTKAAIFGTLVEGNSASLYGGGIFVNNEAALEVAMDSKVAENSCGMMGGGILGSRETSICITNGTLVESNKAREGGGLAFLSGSESTVNTLLVKGSTFSRNMAELYAGGGMSIDFTSVELVNVSLLENSAAYIGGAVASIHSVIRASGCLVQGNYAFAGGGIAVWFEGFLEMNASRILNNTAKDGAGGLLIYNGSKTLFQLPDGGEANNFTGITWWDTLLEEDLADDWCEGYSVCIEGNQASHGAGAIFHSSVGNVLHGIAVTGNVGSDSSKTAVMHLEDGAQVEVRGSRFMENVGSAFDLMEGSALTMSDTVIANHVAHSGAALRVDKSSTAAVSNSLFRNSEALMDGGAVHAAGNLSLVGTQFVGNRARRNGGALFLELRQQTTEVSGCTFERNAATADPSELISGNGGVMFLDAPMAVGNDSAAMGRTHLNGLSFEGNLAVKGGAVGFWQPQSLEATPQPPPCVDCKTIGDSNVAAYGTAEGWATQAVHLEVDPVQDEEASSVRVQHAIAVRITDASGATVTVDNTSMVQIHFKNSEECTIQEGITVIQAVKGVAVFSGNTSTGGLILKGNPGT